MNEMTIQAGGDESKRYVWQGRVWSVRTVDPRWPDEDEAVADDGEVVPIADLLGALYRGEALEQAAPKANVIKQAPAAPGSAPRLAVPAVLAAVRAGEVDAAGKARAEGRVAEAARLGVSLPTSKADGLLFDLGTAVDEGAWASERRAFEELPRGEDRLPAVRDAIRAEDRKDFRFAAWDLRMSPRTGKIGDPSKTDLAWAPSRRGFQGFTTRAGIGAVPDHWPTDIKARAVNGLCERFAKERPRHLLVNDSDPSVVLRVQQRTGRIFACVSPTYGAFDGDLIAEALLGALPRGSRVNVDYDPEAARGRVEIVTLQEERPVVGEPFRTSFTVGWDDTGGGSIWGDGGLFSARCLNLTRIYTSTGTFRIRHAGGVGKLAQRFRCEFERISRVVVGLSRAYGHAASEELSASEKLEATELLQGVYRSLLQRELVTVRGKREDAAKELALQALADENKAGLTRAGIANGITRYAHRTNTDPWFRDELERAAGRILWSPKPVKLDYLAKEAA